MGEPLPWDTPQPHDINSSQDPRTPQAPPALAIESLGPDTGTLRIHGMTPHALGHNRGDSPLTLQIPSPETLATWANRLLKFEFPPSRNLHQAKRLLQKQWGSPKPPQSWMETLNVREIELLVLTLWTEALPNPTPEEGLENRFISHLLLAEECCQFDPVSWALYELTALRESAARLAIPNHAYDAPLQKEPLLTILKAHHFDCDILSSLAPSPSQETLALTYLLCRSMAYPLPWATLLHHLAAQNVLEDYPRLMRLYTHLKNLKTHPQATVWRQYLSTEGPSLSLLEALIAESPQEPSALQSHLFPRPLRRLALVEGTTEEILLPVLAKAAGLDLEGQGVGILSAGGKNQVKNQYHTFKSILNIPIVMVLDLDAKPLEAELRDALRPQDTLYFIPDGEFEDTLSTTLLMETLNGPLGIFPPLTKDSWQDTLRRLQEEAGPSQVEQLKVLWREQQLGAFDKSTFAHQLSQCIHRPEHLSPRQLELLQLLCPQWAH